LVDLERDSLLIFDQVKNVSNVVFQYLRVHFPKGKDFVKHDDFNVVIVGIVHEVQVALNSNFNGSRGSSELSDGVGALKQDRRRLGIAHHEDTVHQSLLLAAVFFAKFPKHF
jgi:hypothetical protein